MVLKTDCLISERQWEEWADWTAASGLVFPPNVIWWLASSRQYVCWFVSLLLARFGFVSLLISLPPFLNCLVVSDRSHTEKNTKADTSGWLVDGNYSADVWMTDFRFWWNILWFQLLRHEDLQPFPDLYHIFGALDIFFRQDQTFEKWCLAFGNCDVWLVMMFRSTWVSVLISCNLTWQKINEVKGAWIDSTGDTLTQTQYFTVIKSQFIHSPYDFSSWTMNTGEVTVSWRETFWLGACLRWPERPVICPRLIDKINGRWVDKEKDFELQVNHLMEMAFTVTHSSYLLNLSDSVRHIKAEQL